MDLLILGLSSLVQRRVLPALRAVESIGRVDVATRKAKNDAIDWKDGAVFSDYADALRRSNAELVYVSLVNSEHEQWTREALTAGRHVVVDKPAFIAEGATERMLELAGARGRCLAEATVYGYHPQVDCMQSLFREAGCAPTRITAEFCFPALDPSNFRYQKALGGGALWDVGPYAVSIGRIFFGGEPVDVACEPIAPRKGEQVETGFSVLASYPGGRMVAGQFGFDSVYRNRVDVLGDSIGVEIDRFYTTPPEVANEVRIIRQTGTSTVAAPSGDAFATFFAHVCARIEHHDWGQLTADLAGDARTLRRLRRAAGLE